MSRRLAAAIRFLPAEEGGFRRDPQIGVRPLIRVAEILTSCVVTATGVEASFERGREYEVTLEVLFWDEYCHLFRDGMVIELYDGSRCVGRGRFLEPIALPPRS